MQGNICARKLCLQQSLPSFCLVACLQCMSGIAQHGASTYSKRAAALSVAPSFDTLVVNASCVVASFDHRWHRHILSFVFFFSSEAEDSHVAECSGSFFGSSGEICADVLKVVTTLLQQITGFHLWRKNVSQLLGLQRSK